MYKLLVPIFILRAVFRLLCPNHEPHLLTQMRSNLCLYWPHSAWYYPPSPWSRLTAFQRRRQSLQDCLQVIVGGVMYQHSTTPYHSSVDYIHNVVIVISYQFQELPSNQSSCHYCNIILNKIWHHFLKESRHISLSSLFICFIFFFI